MNGPDALLPLKICFVTSEYPPDWGGISKSAKRIVGMLAERGMAVHVFVLDRQGAGRDDFVSVPQTDDGQITIHRVSAPDDTPQGAALALMNAIHQVDLQIGFDLFHGFFLPMAYPCVALPGRGARPVVASIRGDDAASMLEPGPYLEPILAAVREASWITSVSSDGLKRVQALTDIAARSSFIPNSIRLTNPPRWRATPDNVGVVGTVCTFRPKKDLPTLIGAYGALPAALRRRLLLVGDYFEGDSFNRQRIEEAIAGSGAAEQIGICGYVENAHVLDYLMRMRVFVLSSLHEGFPNTLLEAASVGLPIVATAVDGVKDVYGADGEGAGAILVPPGDPQALSAAVARVLSDPALAERLSEASLKTAERFSYAHEQEVWVSLYGDLVAAEQEVFY